MEKNNATARFLRVYYAPLPSVDFHAERLACEKRKEAVLALKNEAAQREKFFVWRLLEYAVRTSTGLDINKINPRLEATGKWVCDGLFFSLSHSDRGIAAAVSDEPCGVDIEREVPPRDDNFAKKILNEQEMCEYISTPKSERAALFTEFWSKKESLFKMGNDSVFSPKKIDTHSSSKALKVTLLGDGYVLSVASKNADAAEFFLVDCTDLE